MKTEHILVIAFAGVMFSSCATMPQKVTMATPEYAAQEPIATSLFPSDQAVLGDEAVGRILSSKLELPAKAKLALMKFPDGEGWGSRYYWRVGSDTYSQSRTFAKDRVKAYSTCELVLLDVRTGLVPFTRVISRERLELKQPADLDLTETMRRAEHASALEALKTAAEDLVRFVKSVPRKSG